MRANASTLHWGKEMPHSELDKSSFFPSGSVNRADQSLFWLATVITTILAFPPSSQAGVYGSPKLVPGPTVEADGSVKPLSFGQFRLYFTLYTVDLINPKSETSKSYVAERDRLRALAKKGTLKSSEALDLSVLLMRLREFDEAVQVLTPFALRERNNFMVVSNLASAYQASGKLDRASAYLQQVQDMWPREWPGLTKAQLDWYHELEKCQTASGQKALSREIAALRQCPREGRRSIRKSAWPGSV